MEGEQSWEWVTRQVRRTLRRFGDRDTNVEREDIVQEACLLVWQWADRLHDDDRLGAAVRTIARRQRLRTMHAVQKRRCVALVDFSDPTAQQPAVPFDADGSLTIAGKPVSLRWACGRLDLVMRRLPQLDRQLLMGFHEGFCCAELASRFGRSEVCVKARISRARRRVRTVFEDLVRVSGELEESGLEEE